MQLNKFKNILENERNDIITRTQLIANQELDCSGDDTDRVQGGLLIQTSNQILARDGVKLQKINASLKRIQDGSFGICLSCGDEIDEKRLLISPVLTLCIGCAEVVEMKKKKGLV